MTKEHADASYVKANCLLTVRGKYYYAEEFGKFIEIEKWEYDRILNNPYLYYFSTALKKHFEWCAAVGEARTVTLSDVVGQTHSVMGSPDGESVSLAEPNENARREYIASLLGTLRDTFEQFQMSLTNRTLLCLAIAATAALVLHNSRAPNHSTASGSTVAQSREIRRAIPVESEIRKAIAVEG